MQHHSPRSLRSVLGGALALGIGLFVLLPIGCGATKSEAQPGVKCTPGNYVFCRCQNREEGTKLCNEDGASFARCEPCETADNPAIPDDPYNPPPEVDAGDRDVQQPGVASCGDKIVQDGEDCDDGNKVEDDGCDSDCHLAGSNPLSSRSCPGLETHVWSKSVTWVGSTAGSTNTGTAKPACPAAAGTPPSGSIAADRIFKVTAHKSGTLTVVTTDTNYDNFLYAGTICKPADIAQTACSNKTVGVGGETLTLPVTSGSTYVVVVDGVSSGQGAFRVTFSIQ